ncbi:hypothetical protein N752_10050 [Desulforamulus aquiferis]|nr:hypothetical protein N752_10050 [Desulforamulus aquiferis]
MLPFEDYLLKEVMLDLIPTRLHQVNLKAFELGQQAMGGA